MGEVYHDLRHLQEHPDIALALGNMVVAWSYAESAILQATCTITGMSHNQLLEAYYRIPTFESRVKFVVAAVPEWKTTTHDKDAVVKAIEAIKGLAATRNNWVHNVWCVGKESKSVVVFNFRADVDRGRRKPVKAHDIMLHVKTVLERTNELRLLVPLPDNA